MFTIRMNARAQAWHRVPMLFAANVLRAGRELGRMCTRRIVGKVWFTMTPDACHWAKVALVALWLILLPTARAWAQVPCSGLTCGGQVPCTFVVAPVTIPDFVPDITVHKFATIPAFNTSLGTLVGVQVTATLTAPRAILQFENTNTRHGIPPCDGCLTGLLPIFVEESPNLTGGGIPTTCFNAITFHFQRTLPSCIPPFDNVLDFGGCGLYGCSNPPTGIGCSATGSGCMGPLNTAIGSGITYCGVPGINADGSGANSASCTFCVTSGTVFTQYQTTGVTFDLSAFPQQGENTTCGSQVNASRICLNAVFNVTYFYCANQPPTCNPDAVKVCRNITDCPSFVDIFPLLNDCDPAQTCGDGTTAGQLDCTSFMIVASPSHGTLSMITAPPGVSVPCPAMGLPTGNCPGTKVRYTPTAGYTGTDTFSYKVGDTNSPVRFSSPCSVFITVCNPPNANDDSFSTCVDKMVTINVLANDTPGAAQTPGGGFLTCPQSPLDCTSVMLVSGPSHGSVLLGQPCGSLTGQCSPNGANSCIKYTPAAGYSGTDSFTYKVFDTSMPPCCDTGVVNLTIFCAPIAVDDQGMMCEPLSQDFTVLGLINNDKVCPGPMCASGCPNPSSPIDCNSIMIVSNPSHGSLTLNVACTDGFHCFRTSFLPVPNDSCPANKCVKYTPEAGFTGDDSFTYKVNDSRTNSNTAQSAVFPCTSNVATATIKVKCNPDARDDLFNVPLTPANPMADLDVLLNDLAQRAGCNDGISGVTIPHDAAHVMIVPSTGPGTLCEGPLFGTVSFDMTTFHVKYTLTAPTLPATGDHFCYKIVNSEGCCDMARVTVIPNECIPPNRRLCASLLLFPEFDNHDGVTTIITITDGCCIPGSVPRRVQFKFVRRDDCSISDSFITLTPCDTFTFITRNVNSGGPNAQGYFYAYATNTIASANNPTGTPIVFNHLIGQELILDGLDELNYSMNAVGFRGLGHQPMPEMAMEGEENDDDHDGIRDLNGPLDPRPEYDVVPDLIKIPRFLGQDARRNGDDMFRSRLILINLSGGARFTTIIHVEGFNDNEQLESQDFQFFCWDKPLLRDVAAFTLESHLDSTLNDPDEIIGEPEKEAGWFTVDGLIDQSSIEVITNPAVYAVLIEIFGECSAADLPWECGCADGALLPKGILGDGDISADNPFGIPQNGDNH